MTEQTPAQANDAKPPKQADRPRSSRVEIATFVLVALGSVGLSGKFVLIDWPALSLDRREKEIAVANTEAESVSVYGQILGPDVYVADGKDSVPVCPVFVHIENTGKVPSRVERIDFRVFVAPLRTVSRLSQLDMPKDGIILASAERPEGYAPHASIVGIIDPDSDQWVEKAELSKSMVSNGGSIPPGQSRVERLHVFAPTHGVPVLTKVEVTVHTARSKQRWYGFASHPAVCGVEPIATSATSQ